MGWRQELWGGFPGGFFQRADSGTSLVVRWLRLYLPMQGLWVQSLVAELRSHVSPSQKKKKNQHKTEAAVF